jgi:hypothetical protein
MLEMNLDILSRPADRRVENVGGDGHSAYSALRAIHSHAAFVITIYRSRKEQELKGRNDNLLPFSPSFPASVKILDAA